MAVVDWTKVIRFSFYTFRAHHRFTPCCSGSPISQFQQLVHHTQNCFLAAFPFKICSTPSTAFFKRAEKTKAICKMFPGTYSRDNAWLFWNRSSGKVCSWFRFRRLGKQRGRKFHKHSQTPIIPDHWSW